MTNDNAISAPPAALADAVSAADPAVPGAATPPPPAIPVQKPGELGGPTGPEPTRYGDWERKGRCSDF
ncbi:MAG: DUF1674 domain-containing protein [Azospirillum sp.]|nr:DUF1674 domain-containing protein [Azospirillum sp.]